MPKPAWEYMCPGCGRPFVIRSEPEQPLPASALVVDADMYEMADWEGECSACGLRVLWEVASLEIRFTNAFELKVPRLVETEIWCVELRNRL